ncbi:MAG: hypothetical protein E6I69_08285 [Chloroflexi bacterium]|nr:MAG: hypothetical protein E6I69_08285 [Chloroflexota bacterium]
MSRLRLLSGPDLAAGSEALNAHVQRLGPLPAVGPGLFDSVERSGLTGRGGAAFPVARKWRAVSAAGGGGALIVNGAEGEPQSFKDRTLMSLRPHLVLDGALLAARAVRASSVVLYIGEEHRTAQVTMARAVAERPEHELRHGRVVLAPARYVAGESSAAVNLLNADIASPTTRPPSPHEGGGGRLPTLVQNVETLAQVALIARYGADWFRSAGRRGAAGTILMTVAGAVTSPGVVEVEAGISVREVLELAGGATQQVTAVLLGGYFGSWVDAASAWDLPLDASMLRERGLTLGCGVVGFLPVTSCGVCETARIMEYLASESSAQCGPCFFGLRALATTSGRIAQGIADPGDLARLERWSREVRGRGACHHPDGAAGLLQSALTAFAQEFLRHPAHLGSQVA